MKVNVTFDCTPEEARQFLGLPDVTAFQEEMMDIMRDKAMESMKLMEPEAAMKAWFPLMNQGMSQGMDFFKSMMSGAASSAMASGAGARKKSDK